MFDLANFILLLMKYESECCLLPQCLHSIHFYLSIFVRDQQLMVYISHAEATKVVCLEHQYMLLSTTNV